MQEEQSCGIDLPMTALAYQDQDGAVWLLYNDVEVPPPAAVSLACRPVPRGLHSPRLTAAFAVRGAPGLIAGPARAERAGVVRDSNSGHQLRLPPAK